MIACIVVYFLPEDFAHVAAHIVCYRLSNALLATFSKQLAMLRTIVYRRCTLLIRRCSCNFIHIYVCVC